MASPPSNARGIVAILFATASYVVCDICMKLVMQDGMPPFQVLFVRGIFAVFCCAALVLTLGQWGRIRGGFGKASLLRAVFETGSVLCYIVALSSMPIADAISIVQTAPLIFVLLLATLGRERIGMVRIALIAAGFLGALLVAQPDASGFTPAALLAFAAAFGLAFRDIAGRAIPAATPALVATLATNIVVLAASGVGMVMTEEMVMPSASHALYLLASGLFVTLGHYGVFIAYRLGAPGVIAPFFYSFCVWSVLAGLIVFAELPNPLALTGIATIVASGLGIILLDRRRARLPEPVPESLN